MSSAAPSNELLNCTFCGKTQRQVKKLISGPGAYICDECIELCNEIIEEERAKQKADGEPLPTPIEIFDYLEEFIVGQTGAKRALAVAVYNHYKRTRGKRSSRQLADVEIAKSNILMLGPTGCGKTYLAQTLAKLLNVPFAIADATALTEAGYVGEDVENILLKLIQAADNDIERAQSGIIYIDEIDKISRKADNPSLTRDVSGEGVQQALLKIIEGTQASVPPQGGRKHPQAELITIDTSNILIIVAGAFQGLEKIVADRVGKKGMGFGADVAAASTSVDDINFADVKPEDLVKFGLIPEFIGRLPVVTNVESLDQAALVEILSTPKNSLTKQYQALFAMDGVELEFTADALERIADLALERGTGARGLRAILEDILQPCMFEIPSRDDVHKVVIEADCVTEGKKPLMVISGAMDKSA